MRGASDRSVVIFLRLIGTWVAAALAWYAMAMLVGSIVWRLCHGHPVFGAYGSDKGLSNLVLECPAVLLLTTLVFPFTKPGREGRWWPRAVWIIILVGLLVTILVPGLPE